MIDLKAHEKKKNASANLALSIGARKESESTRDRGVKGATLMEVVLYAAFVTATLLASGQFMLQILSEKARIAAMEDIASNADFALARINMHIRESDLVITPVVGGTDSVLSLGGIATTTYMVNNGVLEEATETETLPLTTKSVTVSDLSVSEVAYSNAPSAIRIQMTFRPSDTRSAADLEQTFYTTAVVRKTQ